MLPAVATRDEPQPDGVRRLWRCLYADEIYKLSHFKPFNFAGLSFEMISLSSLGTTLLYEGEVAEGDGVNTLVHISWPQTHSTPLNKFR
jgi:hypothetical protein